MRILATLGSVVLLAVMAAFGGTLVAQQIELTARQNRALNADIDRIVAERHSKTRAFTEVARAGLPALASASGGERVEEQVRKIAANPAPQPDPRPDAKPEPMVQAAAAAPDHASDSANAKERVEPQRAQKNRRKAARVLGQAERIPLAFMSLPKFAANALFGWR